MRRKLRLDLPFGFLLVALLMMAGLSSCRHLSAPYFHDKALEIPWRDGDMAAVGFLGYYDSFESFMTSPNYKDIESYYPQIEDLDLLVSAADGDELYVVIPREGIRSTLVVETFSDEQSARPLYEGEDGPFFVKGNPWNQASNMRLSLMDASGRMLEYTPCLDETTGLLKGQNGILDVSVEQPSVLEGFAEAIYPDSVLGVRSYVRNGRAILEVDFSSFERMGLLQGGDYGMENPVMPVAELGGYCRGVYLGNFGMGPNPVLALIMENDDVQVLSVRHALDNGDMAVSGRLEGISHVRSLSGGVSSLNHMDMDVITATDASGVKTDLPLFFYPGTRNRVSQDSTRVYTLMLSSDWKMEYGLYSRDGEFLKGYLGRFRALEEEEGGEGGLFHYRFDYQDGELTGTSVLEGDFLLQPADSNCVSVTPLSGIELGDGGMSLPRIFSEGYWPEEDQLEED